MMTWTWEAGGVVVAAAGLLFTILSALAVLMWKSASTLAEIRTTTHRELNTNHGTSTKDHAMAAARDARRALAEATAAKEESAGARAEAAAAREAALSAHEVMSGHLDWHLRDITP